MILPQILWKSFAFLFALYMGGFQTALQWRRRGCKLCVINHSSCHFSDLTHNWVNTVWGSFSLQVPVCYQIGGILLCSAWVPLPPMMRTLYE